MVSIFFVFVLHMDALKLAGKWDHFYQAVSSFSFYLTFNLTDQLIEFVHNKLATIF